MQEIQLYSMATPNGQKVGIALEEMELPYQAHLVNITKDEQFKPDFIKISPNSKIPAIVDPQGPDGKSLSIFESGAILMYLGQKSGRFWPKDQRAQVEVMEWLFFQVGGVGPIFGQFGHFFKFAADKCDHPYPLERYTSESKRYLKVLEARLSESQYLAAGQYTIADMATVTWVNALSAFYKAEAQLELDRYPHVGEWKERVFARPAVQRGLVVCKP